MPGLSLSIGVALSMAAQSVTSFVNDRVLFVGDSITAWTNGFPDLFAFDNPKLDKKEDAVAGTSINTGANSFMSRQASALAQTAEVLVILPGANDLSDSATYPAVSNWMTALYNFTDPFRSAGTKVYVIPPLPQGTSYPGSATHNTRRATVRTTLLAAIGTKIDGVLDLNSTTLGPDSAANDTNLFSDGLHPTDAAHVVLLNAIMNPIRVALGLAAWTPADYIYPGGAIDGAFWDVSDISSLFQDTAAATPVAASGDAIGRINDKSGNGYHLLQATAANKPLYRTNGGAGGTSKYADFDGTNDNMATAAFSSKAQPHWQMVACKLDNSAANGEITDGVANGSRASLLNVGGTGLFLQSGAGVDSGLDPDNSDVVLAGKFQGGSSAGYKDGVAGSAVNSGANPLTGVTVGSSYVPNTWMDGRLYRMVHTFAAVPNVRVQGYLLTWCGAGQGRTL